MYVYESHLGGLYTSETEYDYDDLYCDECGDSDNFIGDYDNIKDFLKENANEFNVDDSGGYVLDMALDNLYSLGSISLKAAEKIVRENRTIQEEYEE